MGCVHLAKDGKHVVMLFLGDGLGKRGGDRITIWLCARRQPKSDGGERV
jgi:hypothetical protein